MPKSKVEKEFQADENGTVLVPKEIVPAVPETVLKKAVKRVMSEKQMENARKMIEANKERWAKIREAKELAKKEEEEKRKAEEEEKIQAGTHVRVKLAEKRVYKPREKVEMPDPLPLKRQDAYSNDARRKVRMPIVEESDTVTETETEEEEEEEERPKARAVRREMKKTLRVVEKVDAAIQQATNPYLSMLQGRWR